MEERIEIRDIRQPGWFFVDNEIIDVYGKEIGVYGIVVYAILARHASQDSQKAWPSIRHMAEMLGTGKKQIQNALLALKDVGLIHIERTNRHNTYTLLNVKQIVLPERTIEEEREENVLPKRTQCPPREDDDVLPERTEQNTYNNTKEQQQIGVVVASSLSPQKETAKRFLMEQGVSEHMARKLAHEISATRILEVVLAANKKTNIKEKSAWIVQALRQGWQVSFKPEEPQSELDRAIARKEYWVRDPRTGEWITPEEMEALGK